MFLGQRWDRFQALLKNKDIWGATTIRAFLLTPREEFASVNPAIYKRAYEHNFLDIGYGVTMSGPHLQGRMTNVIDVKRGEKVLEIGTGSGVQSAYIANLTENAYTIEIIAPLAQRTRALYVSRIGSLMSPSPAPDRRRISSPASSWMMWTTSSTVIIPTSRPALSTTAAEMSAYFWKRSATSS